MGVIKRMFLDPTASHLIISTTLGDNYYLHSQSRQPRPLSRLRGVSVECVAWNPSLPTASTREILIGATDGNIYEVYIETSTEFYRREDKYLKSLQKLQDGAITGLWVDEIPGQTTMRRVIITTQSRILHLLGKVTRSGAEGGGSIYAKMFETEQPTVHEISSVSRSAASSLVVSPDSPEASSPDALTPERIYAWLSSQGVLYGKLLNSPANSELGDRLFAESKLLPMSVLPIGETNPGRKKAAPEAVKAIALTQWHILHLIGGRVVAINRLDDTVVFDQIVLDPGQKAVGLFADRQKNTFWLFTDKEIYEILARDEDRDVWKVMLRHQNFEAALKYAKSASQKDAVATASGDWLISKKMYAEAASVYGKSSKAFEQVALTFIEHEQQDALRKYLLTKITTLKKSWIIQRIMIASWLVEIFMSKLNTLDDTIITKAELDENATPQQSQDQLESVRKEYQDFVQKYKNDLDRKTTYDIISSHGREDELLYFASAVNDHNYVLAYWVQRERWSSALTVLKKQTDPHIFYTYSSVLITHAADDLIDILMRHPNLKPRNLIPALLTYNRSFEGPLSKNQAVRYLLYTINTLNSTDAAVHNTLISIYASHPSPDETQLLTYFETQGEEPSYDADFALRLCIEHKRVQACVHIYTTMAQYLQAVTLALQHGNVDLASSIADRPLGNDALRKKLWLLVAKSVIGESNGISAALGFLQKGGGAVLKIEDLIPFFPDFVVIDEFKESICEALESYSRDIDSLKEEMDNSALTANNIKEEITELEKRYAVVRPGEKCGVCGLPLLVKQFFVFSCQHAFHSECLGRKVVEGTSGGEKVKGRRIKELQEKIARMKGGKAREAAVAELDALVAGDW